MIQTLLLAAGYSRRFGSDKLLHVLPNGKTIIEQSLATLQAVTHDITVVIRPQQEPLHAWLQQHGIAVVVCPEAEQGMGHSIACGVNAYKDADGWLIALADMPYVSSNTIQAVYDALQQGITLCRPRYQGQAGHPVGVHRQYLPQLLQLAGDAGLRQHLDNDEIWFIDVNDAGCVYDIDHPSDIHD